MEIEIDSGLVSGIVAPEYKKTRDDLGLGAVNAYRASVKRHDDRLVNAPDAPMLACKAGCYWCCFFSVDVRAVEVFAILEFVEQNFSAEEKARVRGEAIANSRLLENLSELERGRQNVKCPFLVNGRCSIYAVRPQTCRNYHATDAAGCKKSFEEPDNLDIDPDFAPLTYQIGRAHVDAFSKAMRDAGYDIGAYELNAALQATIDDPTTARKRFEEKQRVFPSLECTEAPFELIDTII